MTIRQQIERRIEEVNADPTESVADRISREAFEALFGGVTSAEWTTFMRNFVENQSPSQLARLTLNDSQATDPALRRALVYVAASSMCGAATITMLTNYVNLDVLDKTLDCPPADGGAGGQTT